MFDLLILVLVRVGRNPFFFKPSLVVFWGGFIFWGFIFFFNFNSLNLKIKGFSIFDSIILFNVHHCYVSTSNDIKLPFRVFLGVFFWLVFYAQP